MIQIETKRLMISCVKQSDLDDIFEYVSNPEYIPSWKVMENVGLKKEGLFKKRFNWKKDAHN